MALAWLRSIHLGDDFDAGKYFWGIGYWPQPDGQYRAAFWTSITHWLGVNLDSAACLVRMSTVQSVTAPSLLPVFFPSLTRFFSFVFFFVVTQLHGSF